MIVFCKKDFVFVHVLYKSGKRYECENFNENECAIKDDNDNRCHFYKENKTEYAYHFKFDDHFMTLQEYRQLKIKEIID